MSKCEYKGGGVGLNKTSERRVECRSVSTNEGGGGGGGGGVRFNIIDSRIECRSVSTKEGGGI